MNSFPYEIRNQIIQCFGLCFHYKDNVETFLLTCGVSKELARRYKHEAKFVWIRHLLSDLDEIQDGDITQRCILTELCKLRNLPDKDAPNPNAGLEALRKLKLLALEHDLIIKSEKEDLSQRIALAEEKTKIIRERAELLKTLYEQFLIGVSSTDRQAAGYSLEDILEKLFPLFELEYRKSYKIETQQIDGHFRFEGFDYLVEAKWRKDIPTEQEIAGFKRKVNTKLESTRGIFISINGFREEVIRQFSGINSNILFMTGEDLVYILEGRIDLQDALRIKVEKAAQEGKILVSIPEILKPT